jgi:UDP-N-acetylglucosamine:LPS N-acetylglucosamine transferase
MKLKQILNEAPRKSSYPKEITDLIDTLISTMGYKRYELSYNKSVNTLAGRYVIQLPTTGFTVPQLKNLISILDPDMIVQYAPYTSHNGMIIKTDIKVK